MPQKSWRPLCARHSKAEGLSTSSIAEISPGQLPHSDPGDRSLAQLHNEARQRGVKGRYQMSKAQLEQALKH